VNLSIPFNFSLKRFHSVIILASGVFLFLLSAQNVFAITLTPPRLELAGDPGEAINSSFKVTNDSNSNVTYYTQGGAGVALPLRPSKTIRLFNWQH
jgi:hypothetical protein